MSCMHCGADGPDGDKATDEHAAEAWNNRAAIAAQAQPSPADELKAFDAWYHNIPGDQPGYDSAWKGWQGRAALIHQAAVKDSLTLEQVEAIADVDDAAYCLLAILQRVGPGATVGQVLAILEQAQQAQGVPAEFLPVAVSSAPHNIWLDLGFDPYEEDAHFSNLHKPTWSEDNASGNGIKYVRADLLAAAPQAEPQPSYRPDYPNSETVLGAENEKARQDERLFGVGFTVNGWHVPAHLVSKWGAAKAPAPQAEPQTQATAVAQVLSEHLYPLRVCVKLLESREKSTDRPSDYARRSVSEAHKALCALESMNVYQPPAQHNAEPQPEREPLSEAAREQLWQQHWPHGQGWGGKEWHRQGLEDAEKAHGIGTKGGGK